MARADGKPQEIHIEKTPDGLWKLIYLWGLLDVEEEKHKFKTRKAARMLVDTKFPGYKGPILY